MRILVAPNAFKGSLSVTRAAKAFARGAVRAIPNAETILFPISDGGDGLIESLLWDKGGKEIKVRIKGPMSESRSASFARLSNGDAIVEMARASGLALVPEKKRNPLKATSWGTGDLIAAAINRGARRIIIGMGGSASSDGGSGMAQALGARLLDARGKDILPGVEALLRLSRINAERCFRLAKRIKVIALSDVANPLIGPRGSARVFGPQKGADAGMVEVLEDALGRYAFIVKRDLGLDIAAASGGGAAGGLGAGLLAFLGAEIVPGFDWMMERLKIKKRFSQSAAVLTGEGRLDATSFYGKAPVEMARLALAQKIPIGFVCGKAEKKSAARLKAMGVNAVVDFSQIGAKPRDAEPKAAFWAARGAEAALKIIGPALFTLCLAVFSARSAPNASFLKIDRLYFHRNQDHNLDKSVLETQRMLEENPGNPELLWREGRGLIREGESSANKRKKIAAFKKAIAVLNHAVAANPKNVDAHYWLGVALGRFGQARGIIKSLFLVGPLRREMKTVLSLDPNYAGAYRVLGEMHLQLPRFAGGDRLKGIAEIASAVRLAPGYTTNYIALAKAYSDNGQKNEAIATLRRALAVKVPADPAEYSDDMKQARKMLHSLGAAP
ncbi:MAG: glycerate kinase family protein [Elusimicrobiota bacterium]